MEKYIALLRGINVGGNKKVPMSDLKKMFDEIGFSNVKTLLASGNVLFETDEDFSTLKDTLEKKFKEIFGFTSSMIIIPIEKINELIASDPFRNIKVDKDIRLYITFLSEKSKTNLEIPYVSSNGDFKILSANDLCVVSVLTLSEKFKSTDLMNIIEKEFGKNVTTRNWNTVLKLVK